MKDANAENIFMVVLRYHLDRSLLINTVCSDNPGALDALFSKPNWRICKLPPKLTLDRSNLN